MSESATRVPLWTASRKSRAAKRLRSCLVQLAGGARVRRAKHRNLPYFTLTPARRQAQAVKVRNAECGMQNGGGGQPFALIPHSEFRTPHSISWPIFVRLTPFNMTNNMREPK